MRRSLAMVLTLAVVVPIAGCGGSSHPATTAAPGASATGAGGTSSTGEVVAAKNRGFVTVIPSGYRRVPSQAEYLASGPEEEGLAATVIVVRAPARGSGADIGALARSTIAALRTSPKVSQLTGPQALTVDGRPALSIEEVVAEGAGMRHGRLVLVRHGAWVYRILDLALPAQLGAAQSALREVLGHWRWT